MVGSDDAGLEFVGRGILFRQPRCDGGNGSARLRDAAAGREAADDVDPLVVPPGTNLVLSVRVPETRMLFERNEELFPMEKEMSVESLRRDADDDMRDRIQGERLADDVRIGSQ